VPTGVSINNAGLGSTSPTNGFNSVFPPGPPVTPQPYWHWDTSTQPATILGYSLLQYQQTGVDRLTKTGLGPSDLQQFVGIPLQFQGSNAPIADSTLIQWIRWAEDEVETRASCFLTTTWVASPPERQPYAVQAAGLSTPTGTMILGQDYDYGDAPYDFDMQRFIEDGWGVRNLRHRPIQDIFYTSSVTPGQMQGFTAIKNMVFFYPLLNQFYQIPAQWFVEDPYAAFVRIVPAVNIMMLPIYALQVSMLGFAQSLPGAIHLQYVSGFTDADLNGRFSFVKQLVLVKAAMQAFRSIQPTINAGMVESSVDMGTWSQDLKYLPAPFQNVIQSWKEKEKQLETMLKNELGPTFHTLG